MPSRSRNRVTALEVDLSTSFFKTKDAEKCKRVVKIIHDTCAPRDKNNWQDNSYLTCTDNNYPFYKRDGVYYTSGQLDLRFSTKINVDEFLLAHDNGKLTLLTSLTILN